MYKHLQTHLRFLFFRKPLLEIEEELRLHLEQSIEANIASGIAPQEARRQALIALGGIERARAECHEERPSFQIETVLQDVRYAFRGFHRNRMFTAAVVLTLMLGIGCTIAVFSVVDRILFRSLPYEHADRLVSVGLSAPIAPQEFMLGGSYYDWRDNQTPFAAFTSETGITPCDLTEERPSRLNCASVESSFLPAFGIHPILGRVFTSDEDRPQAPKVALISYPLWRSRFGSNSKILNQLVSLDGSPTRVIGVLPENFEMPTLETADVILPQALDEAAQRKADPGRVMYAFARLKPGMSIEQAKTALEPVFNYSLRLAPAPFRKEVHLQVRSLHDRQVQGVRVIAWVLFGLVLAVLFIACANVANLLVARGASRERELAVRSALGASRVRLIRQALTESSVLSLVGGIAGLAFAELLLHLFIAVAPKDVLFLSKATIDWRIVSFTFVLSLLCSMVIGLFSALHKPRAQVLAGRATLASPQARVRQGLVVAQIAASMVLLACSALLFRSFVNLQNQQLGMQTHAVITASISLGQNSYGTQQRQMVFYEQLEQNLKYEPGVTEVSLSDTLPPGGFHHDQIFASIAVDGKPKSPSGTGGLVAWRWIRPDYFRALGISLLKGRDFTEADLTSNDRPLILSKALAVRLFPGKDPVGERLSLAVGAADNPLCTVVGVVADVRNGGLAGDNEPEYYRLRRHQPQDWNRDAVFIFKTTLPTREIETWIRSQVALLDPTVPVEVQTLSQRVSKMVEQPRFETLLVGFFALSGLLLAVVGLYGVISFFVAQRTPEIGIRIALGATRGDILRLVMVNGFRLISLGMILGLVSALASAHVLTSLLFSVRTSDPLSFIVVALLLAVVGSLAIFIPARAATKIDPFVALRCE